MSDTILTEQDVREAQLEAFYHLLMAKKTLMIVGDGAGGSAIKALEESESILEGSIEKTISTNN